MPVYLNFYKKFDIIYIESKGKETLKSKILYIYKKETLKCQIIIYLLIAYMVIRKKF